MEQLSPNSVGSQGERRVHVAIATCKSILSARLSAWFTQKKIARAIVNQMLAVATLWIHLATSPTVSHDQDQDM